MYKRQEQGSALRCAQVINLRLVTGVIGGEEIMGKFIFSAWRGIEMDRTWDTLAQDFYDLGLTLPFTPIFKEGSDYAKMIKLLDDFAALGMKVIMCDDRVTARREPVLDEEDYRCLLYTSRCV